MRFVYLYCQLFIAFAAGAGIMDIIIRLWMGLSFMSLFPFVLCLVLAAMACCLEYYLKGK